MHRGFWAKYADGGLILNLRYSNPLKHTLLPWKGPIENSFNLFKFLQHIVLGVLYTFLETEYATIPAQGVLALPLSKKGIYNWFCQLLHPSCLLRI